MQLVYTCMSVWGVVVSTTVPARPRSRYNTPWGLKLVLHCAAAGFQSIHAPGMSLYKVPLLMRSTEHHVSSQDKFNTARRRHVFFFDIVTGCFGSEHVHRASRQQMDLYSHSLCSFTSLEQEHHT